MFSVHLASAQTTLDDSAKTNFWYQFGNGWTGPTNQDNWDYGFAYSTNRDFDVALNGVTPAFEFIPMTAELYYSSVPFWGHLAQGDPSGTCQLGWEAHQWYENAPPTETENSYGGPLGAYVYAATGPGEEGPVLATNTGNDGIIAILRWTAPANGTVTAQGDFLASGINGDMSVGIVRYGGGVSNQFVLPRTLISRYNTDDSGNLTTNTYPADLGFSTNLTVVVGEHIAFILGNGDDGYAYNTIGMQVNMFFTPSTTLTPTAISVSSSSQTNFQGGSVTFTAKLPSLATGNVTFLTNGAVFSVNAITNGIAQSDSTRLLPVGTNIIKAEYAGDSTYLGSTNNLPGGQVIIPLAMKFSAQPPVVAIGESAAFVGMLQADATGTVTFLTNGVLLSTDALTDGVAISSRALLSFGSTPVTAVYSGDNNYKSVTNSLAFDVVSQLNYSAYSNFWFLGGYSGVGPGQYTNGYTGGWTGQVVSNTWDYGYAYSTNQDFDVSSNGVAPAFEFISMTNFESYPPGPDWGVLDPSITAAILWEGAQFFVGAPPTPTENPYGGPLGAYLYLASGPGEEGPVIPSGPTGNDGIISIVRWTAPSAGSVAVRGDFYCSGVQGDESFGVVSYGGGASDQIILPRTLASKSNLDINGNSTTNNYPADVLFSTNLTVAAGQHIAFIQGNGNDGYAYNSAGLQANILFTSSVAPPNLHLNIAVQSGKIVLTWSNAGAILQSASNITGPWSNVSGATSPYTVTISGSQLYFRLQQ